MHHWPPRCARALTRACSRCRRFDPLREEPRAWQFSFLADWKQVTVDRLEGSPDDWELLRAARRMQKVVELIDDERWVTLRGENGLLESQLHWCLRRIKYPHARSKDTVDYLEHAVRSLTEHTHVLQALEDRVRKSIEAEREVTRQRTAGMTWLQNLSCNQSAMVKAGSLTSSIHQQLADVIRQPLAAFLFRLEQHSAIPSMMNVLPGNQERWWMKIYMEDDVRFSIETHSCHQSPRRHESLDQKISLCCQSHVYSFVCRFLRPKTAITLTSARTRSH